MGAIKVLINQQFLHLKYSIIYIDMYKTLNKCAKAPGSMDLPSKILPGGVSLKSTEYRLCNKVLIGCFLYFKMWLDKYSCIYYFALHPMFSNKQIIDITAVFQFKPAVWVFHFCHPVSFEIIQCRFPLVGFSSLLLTEEEIWLLLSTSKTQKLRCKNTTKNLTTKIVADSLKHIYKQRLNKDNSKDI